MGEAATLAREKVDEARREADRELDQLGGATRSALDIPAKARRHPLRVIGLASGAAFFALGGPRRLGRAAERRIFPRRTQWLEGVLPKEVSRALDRLGANAESVRQNLELDFMKYLERKHPEDTPSARRSFWKTYDLLVGIVGAAAARELVKKLFAVPKEVRVEEHAENAAIDVAAEEAKAEG